MISKLTGMLLLGALAVPAYATDIYRWTDDTGRVNYGNEVPARFKSVARKIDTSGTQVTVVNGQRQNAAQAARPAEPSASTGSGTPPVGPGGVGY
jgi:hypothetical protein